MEINGAAARLEVLLPAPPFLLLLGHALSE